MTLQQLINKFDEVGISHDWELKLSLPDEYFNLKGISVIGQNEVELIFEDQQRITSLSKDTDEYEITVPY